MLLALAFAGTATAARLADPLSPQEWWLSHIGADRATPPGPGVPITIIDTGVDATHPEFASRPNTADADIFAAAQHCPAVINLSFGSVAQDPELDRAILTAYRNGCLVVAASGNSGSFGSPPSYPAAWPHVLTVGASNANDEVSPFSRTGADVDLVAPGDSVMAA